jgi:hypothetical protein
MDQQDAGAVEAARASEVVKKYAGRNRIAVELPEEAVEALLKGWLDVDPTQPAEISFLVEGREVGNFKIAACAYAKTTCCA